MSQQGYTRHLGYHLKMTMVPRNATTTIASILAFVAAIFTAIYSARLIILTFLSAPNYPYTETIADPPFPLFILAAGAAYLGFLTHEVFNPLFTHPSNLTLGTLSAPSLLKLLPPATLLILLGGISLG